MPHLTSTHKNSRTLISLIIG